MKEDIFRNWYLQKHGDLDAELDDFYEELYEAFCYGWDRQRQITEALDELTKLAQEMGEYD